MVIAIFATQREITFQYRIGEDEFRGPEVVAAVGAALKATLRRAVCGILCCLCGTALCLGVVEETIHVEVNTQLSYLAVIVGIEYVLADSLVLPDTAL